MPRILEDHGAYLLVEGADGSTYTVPKDTYDSLYGATEQKPFMPSAAEGIAAGKVQESPFTPGVMSAVGQVQPTDLQAPVPQHGLQQVEPALPQPSTGQFDPNGAQLQQVRAPSIEEQQQGPQILPPPPGLVGQSPETSPREGPPEAPPQPPQRDDSKGPTAQDYAKAISENERAQFDYENKKEVIDQERADKILEATQDSDRRLDEWEANDAQKRQEALEATEQRLAHMEELNKQYMNAEVDPDRWWNSKGTGTKILAAISMGLGELSDGPNNAMAIINRAVDADLMAQEEKLNRMGKAIENEGQILGYYREHFADEATARQAAKIAIMDDVTRQIDMVEKRASSQMVKVNADNMRSAAEFATAQLREAFRGTLFAQEMEKNRYRETVRHNKASEAINRKRAAAAGRRKNTSAYAYNTRGGIATRKVEIGEKPVLDENGKVKGKMVWVEDGKGSMVPVWQAEMEKVYREEPIVFRDQKQADQYSKLELTNQKANTLLKEYKTTMANCAREYDGPASEWTHSDCYIQAQTQFELAIPLVARTLAGDDGVLREPEIQRARELVGQIDSWTSNNKAQTKIDELIRLNNMTFDLEASSIGAHDAEYDKHRSKTGASESDTAETKAKKEIIKKYGLYGEGQEELVNKVYRMEQMQEKYGTPEQHFYDIGFFTDEEWETLQAERIKKRKVEEDARKAKEYLEKDDNWQLKGKGYY